MMNLQLIPRCVAHLVHREDPTEVLGHICEPHSHAPVVNRELAVELHTLDCTAPCLDC